MQIEFFPLEMSGKILTLQKKSVSADAVSRILQELVFKFELYEYKTDLINSSETDDLHSLSCTLRSASYA